ncbi:MAG: hypothetical protein ACLFP9_00470 [Desulfonatronovibrio sp.]
MEKSPAKIKRLFQEAIDQRSKFIIALPEELTSVSSLNASLMDFNDQYLYLEVSTITKFNPRWEGLGVTCFFRLITRKKPHKEMFFNFKSKISGHEQGRSDQVQIRLEFPEKLEIGQRRSSLRIDMDPRLVLGFSVWEEDRFIRAAEGGNKKGLHPPKISIDHIKSGLIKIIDLSAGGMKKKITPEAVQQLGLNWSKGSTMIIWLVLLDPGTQGKDQFWLKARIKYRYQDFVSKEIDLGLEFTSFGQISPDKKMKWLRVKQNNIDQIGNWTYQRYLEHYRQGLI